MLSHKGVKLIVGGWVFFISENVIVSSYREQIIPILGGEKIYQAIYSCASTAAVGSILLGHFRYGIN